MPLHHYGSWVALTIASAVFLTIQRIIQKKVLKKEHASEYLTTFGVFAWIFLLPFIGKVDFTLSANVWILLAVKSILLSYSWLMITRAYKHMEVSLVEPLKNISPLFLLLFAAILLGELPTGMQVFGIFLILFGGYLLESMLHPSLMNNPFKIFRGKYINYLLLAALITGISGVFDKWILKETNITTMMFFMFFFSSIMLFIHQCIVYKGWADVKHVFKKDGMLVCIIVILTLLSDWLYFSAVALKSSYVSLIVPLRRISSLFVIVIGGEMFHEKKIIEKVLACLIMLIGVYFIVA